MKGADNTRKPKNRSRLFLIDIGSAGTPRIVPVAAGIVSRGTQVSESVESYYRMDPWGAPETALTGQAVSHRFSGHRVKGDQAQDYILGETPGGPEGRCVTFYDCDGSAPAGQPNGWKGRALIRILDDGSGGAAGRQSIAFCLVVNGSPQRGTMTRVGGSYRWTPEP